MLIALQFELYCTDEVGAIRTRIFNRRTCRMNSETTEYYALRKSPFTKTGTISVPCILFDFAWNYRGIIRIG